MGAQNVEASTWRGNYDGLPVPRKTVRLWQTHPRSKLRMGEETGMQPSEPTVPAEWGPSGLQAQRTYNKHRLNEEKWRV